MDLFVFIVFGCNSIMCMECLHGWVHEGCSGKLKRSNVDFHCRRCLEKSPVVLALMREVEIEPNVKLKCVPKFCYLGVTFGAGGGVEEAARVRCAMAKFKELSPILTAHGASYRIKGKQLVSRVSWLKGLKHVQWRLKICLKRAECMILI